MGTGCGTILAQMVCECMDCPLDSVAVFSADTEVSPYRATGVWHRELPITPEQIAMSVSERSE